jgi:DNA-binding CsgD family transcriptional regulator
MFLKAATDLANFLAGSKRDHEDLSKFLVFKTFAHFSPTALYIAEITEDGCLSPTGGYGFEKTAIATWGRFPLKMHIPITDAVRHDKCIVIDRIDYCFEQYPILQEIGNFSTDWGAVVAWPMLPFGVGFAFLESAPTNNSEFEEFLRLIGSVIVLDSSHRQEILPIHRVENARAKKGATKTLSPRQKVILEKLAKGATNSEIALEVGYSESLIRQETIEIYRIMGVSGRKELIAAAGEK